MSTAAIQALAPDRQSDIHFALRSAADCLLSRQSPEGWWVGELEADTSLESDYILLQLWLYPPLAGAWNPPTEGRIARAARYILSRQLPEGGWNIYPGGPANVSVSVKAYLALRLAGYDAEDPQLIRAQEQILELGGVEATNSYTKIYLSFFGLYDRAKTPTIPPELFLLPDKAKFSVYDMSSWTRAIIAPLAILGALGASRPVPQGIGLGELSTDVEPAAGDLFDPNGNMMAPTHPQGFLAKIVVGVVDPLKVRRTEIGIETVDSGVWNDVRPTGGESVHVGEAEIARTVSAVDGDILPLQNWEGGPYVSNVVTACQAVEQEEHGIELCTEVQAPLWIPREGRLDRTCVIDVVEVPRERR